MSRVTSRGFTDGEPADGVAGEVHFDQALGGFAAKVGLYIPPWTMPNKDWVWPAMTSGL